ncbi:hypothetical protein Tco_1219266 [Tanacetum coccineum]
MEHETKHKESQYTITSSDTVALKEFDQERTLFETMTKSKSFDKNPKKADDANRDEDPPAGPDEELKRKKMIKDAKPSKKAKSTGTSKGTIKSQPKSTSKSAQAEETVFEAGDT